MMMIYVALQYCIPYQKSILCTSQQQNSEKVILDDRNGIIFSQSFALTLPASFCCKQVCIMHKDNLFVLHLYYNPFTGFRGLETIDSKCILWRNHVKKETCIVEICMNLGVVLYSDNLIKESQGTAMTQILIRVSGNATMK